MLIHTDVNEVFARVKQIVDERVPSEERVAAFKELWNRGSFLVACETGKKKPWRSLSVNQVICDSDGNPLTSKDGSVRTERIIKRDDWETLEPKIRAGENVLWYKCGAQGVLYLDFDPITEERLAAVSDRLGAEPLAIFPSSGNWKEAKYETPAGYGGHALWRAKPEASINLRDFTHEMGGPSNGQCFSGHPVFGVIVYDPIAALEVMDYDEAEAVDPSRLYKAVSPIKSRGGTGGAFDPNSRHDSAISGISYAARTRRTRKDFQIALDDLGEIFISAAMGGDKKSARTREQATAEWERMAAKGWEYWQADREKEGGAVGDVPDIATDEDGNSVRYDAGSDTDSDLLIYLRSIEPIVIPETTDEMLAAMVTDDDGAKEEKKPPTDEEIANADARMVEARAAADDAMSKRDAVQADILAKQARIKELEQSENTIREGLLDADESERKAMKKEMWLFRETKRGMKKKLEGLAETLSKLRLDADIAGQAAVEADAARYALGGMASDTGDDYTDKIKERKEQYLHSLRPSIIANWESVDAATEIVMSTKSVSQTMHAWWQSSVKKALGDDVDPVSIATAKLGEGCLRLALNFDLTDDELEKEIVANLAGARLCGIDAGDCLSVMKQAFRWREKNTIHALHGKPPVALIKSHDEDPLPTKEAAFARIRRHGGVTIHRQVSDNPSDAACLLRASGFKTIFSYLDGKYFVTHPEFTEWREMNEYTRVEVPDLEHLARVREVLRQNILRPEEVFDPEGRPIGFAIAQVVGDRWGSGKVLKTHFDALKGGAIPIVDFYEDWTRKIELYRAAMSPEELGRCVDLTSNLLLRIPGLTVPSGQEELAIAASRLIYPIFMMRRLESMERLTGEGGVFRQRHFAVFGGEKGVGKTTAAELIAPSSTYLSAAPELMSQVFNDHVDFSGRINTSFQFNSDLNECIRQFVGMVVCLNDELAGMSDSKPNTVKNAITFRSGQAHRKYENYADVQRTDTLIGTTNATNTIPHDHALRDRLVMVQMVRSDPSMSDAAVFHSINDFFARNYTALFIGGLEIALLNRKRDPLGDLNPPKELDSLRAEAASMMSDDTQKIEGAILKYIAGGQAISWVSARGTKWVTVNKMLLLMSALKYQENVYEDGYSVQSPVEGSNLIHAEFGDSFSKSNGEVISWIDDTAIVKGGATVHFGHEFSPWVQRACDAKAITAETQKMKAAIQNALTTLTGKKPNVSARVPLEVSNAWFSCPDGASYPFGENHNAQRGGVTRQVAFDIDTQLMRERLASYLASDGEE